MARRIFLSKRLQPRTPDYRNCSSCWIRRSLPRALLDCASGDRFVAIPLLSFGISKLTFSFVSDLFFISPASLLIGEPSLPSFTPKSERELIVSSRRILQFRQLSSFPSSSRGSRRREKRMKNDLNRMRTRSTSLSTVSSTLSFGSDRSFFKISPYFDRNTLPHPSSPSTLSTLPPSTPSLPPSFEMSPKPKTPKRRNSLIFRRRSPTLSLPPSLKSLAR